MALGALFALANLGLLDIGHVFRFWPVIIIALGISKASVSGQSGAGMVWIAVGCGLLLHTLNVVAIWRLWPFALVLIGAQIAFRAMWRESRDGGEPFQPRDVTPFSAPFPGESVSEMAGELPQGEAADSRAAGGAAAADASGTITAFAFLGGVERTVRSKDFRGGSFVAFMGGCEIDLRGATITRGEAVIDVTVMWGGIEIKVPTDWRVEWRGLALLGGFSDTTRGPAESPTCLVVTGQAIMGGVEIHN
jgi:hypothetical protein